MNWNLEGMIISGMYLSDIPVSGTVTKSYVSYGGGVKHLVELEHAFDAGRGIKREAGETVFVEHRDILSVKDNTYA